MIKRVGKREVVVLLAAGALTVAAGIAAIAVALLRNRRTKQPRPKSKDETSRWKQYGRAHQLGL